MNPILRDAIRHASTKKWATTQYRPTPPRLTASERTAQGIAKAASNPAKTMFKIAAASELADILFGLIRLAITLALIAGLAYGAWAFLKANQPQKATKAPPASMQGSPANAGPRR